MTSQTSENKIELINGSPVFRLRDHLLPLISLEDILEINPKKQPHALKETNAKDTDAQAINDEEKEHLFEQRENTYIVIAQVGEYTFGIIVDRVFDTEEIVVKPVPRILKHIEMFSGNTILGDGSVIMILDPAGIAKATGEIDTLDHRANEKSKDIHSENSQKTALLLFAAGNSAPKAIPLELISRLENIDCNRIENANGKMVVQYRDTLMPLVTFSDEVVVPEEGQKPVLVFADKGKSMGLIVDDIIDITEQHIDLKISAETDGAVGSTIINGKATDIVDVGHYLKLAGGKEWYKDHDDTPFNESHTENAQEKRILLVEDSPFFRNMLTPLLQIAGYQVTTSESATDALKLCDKGLDFDIIVSDIEMPEMSGFEFAEKIRNGTSSWQDIPMVALSSHATPQDIDRGREVGFSNYIPKFDRDTLLNTLSEALSSVKEREAS